MAVYADNFACTEERRRWNREFVATGAGMEPDEPNPTVEWAQASLRELITSQPPVLRRLFDFDADHSLPNLERTSEYLATRMVRTNYRQGTEIPTVLAQLTEAGYQAIAADNQTTEADDEVMSLFEAIIEGNGELTAEPDPDKAERRSLAKAAEYRRRMNGPLYKISPDYRGRLTVWNSKTGTSVPKEEFAKLAKRWAAAFPNMTEERAGFFAKVRIALRDSGVTTETIARRKKLERLPAPSVDDNTFRSHWLISEEHDWQILVTPCDDRINCACGDALMLEAIVALHGHATAESISNVARYVVYEDEFDENGDNLDGEVEYELDGHDLSKAIDAFIDSLNDTDQDALLEVYQILLGEHVDRLPEQERLLHTRRVPRMGKTNWNMPLHLHEFVDDDRQVGL